MKYFILILISLALVYPVNVKAASEDECAIWICLPGGFPSGCGAAYGAFKDRIKNQKPPLPELASCTTGPNGEQVSGSYELGYEYFEPCDDDYVLVEGAQNGTVIGKCFVSACAPEELGQEPYACSNYAAIKRAKPNFIKMWVNGEYIGQFFY